MTFRKLRIAWSVFWGVCCVLLVVLWVRSYWRWDIFAYETTTTCYTLISVEGGVQFMTEKPSGAAWYQVGIADTSPTIANAKYRYMGFKYNPAGFGLSADYFAPNWFLIFLVTTVAIVPWLRIRRFSLRTLLIATTLVAVVLGFAVWAAR